MDLDIITPLALMRFGGVGEVRAEGPGGRFAILPRHADYCAVLPASVLSFAAGGKESFFAVDEGVLVKTGPVVRVSARQAVAGDSLADLRKKVAEEFKALGDEDRKLRSALAGLEAGVANFFAEMKNA
ncbi:MAG: F0F1 ATP synthase subunit epsilon [Rickettsiales bacterium]|jgi:F-type H+-transporting ATPase subunit epsilon|nr:F0F1 ATP synthase subunit epsilon [Rickettsiales bacterium]